MSPGYIGGNMKVIFNEEELQAKCSEWQKILGLQDWDVRLKISRERDLKLSGANAECHWVTAKKQALIRVLDSVDYPESLWEQDMEADLVHELLHLHFAMFAAEDDTLEDTAQEQAITLISKALINLRRE